MKQKLALILVLLVALFRITLWHNVHDNWLSAKTNDSTEVPEDSLFSQIHSTIFAKSCALSGCHDGSFEPDYRTVQSSYNTLVYHPVIKNDSIGSFTYRVVPYDTAHSVLFERITNCCFVNDGDRMPFADPDGLEPEKIDLIRRWIMSGAPDPYGVKAELPEPGLVIGDKPTYYFVHPDNPTDTKLEQDDASKDHFPIYKEGGQLRIQVSISDELSKKALKSARIELYYDIAYSKIMTSAPVTYNNGDLVASFSYDDLPLFSPVFVRLSVKDMNLYYPSDDVYQFMRNSWSFRVGEPTN